LNARATMVSREQWVIAARIRCDSSAILVLQTSPLPRGDAQCRRPREATPHSSTEGVAIEARELYKLTMIEGGAEANMLEGTLCSLSGGHCNQYQPGFHPVWFSSHTVICRHPITCAAYMLSDVGKRQAERLASIEAGFLELR
jgi:hypothetical protein